MSTLNGILGIATSALQTAQTGLSIVSDNISNVNTTGYIRKTTSQTSLTAAGAGQGVSIAKVTLAANAYLQEVALRAASDSARAGAVYKNLDQAQSQFGDPSASGSLFSKLDSVFASFATLASANTASNQSQSLNQLRSFLSNASSIKTNLDALKTSTTNQITGDVTQINDLLKKISDLNSDINRSTNSSSDVTGYQNQQSGYVDQLSKLMDIRVTADANASGAITIRASDGTPLTGIGRNPATFTYDQSSGTGQILFTPAGGAQQPFGGRLTNGELQGLLTSLNTDLPNLSQELAQLTAGAATALNAASNAYSATPAPASLTGKDTGIDVPSAIAGFTGKTTIAIVNAAGVVQTSVAIDFSAGTLSVNGGAATSFTAANFVTSLNTALGGSGSASVSGNVLTLAATGGNGVAVADDPTTPSQAGGKGFSQYFGLNDAITTAGQSDYNTGLPGTGLSGFNSGTIQFRIGAHCFFVGGTEFGDHFLHQFFEISLGHGSRKVGLEDFHFRFFLGCLVRAAAFFESLNGILTFLDFLADNSQHVLVLGFAFRSILFDHGVFHGGLEHPKDSEAVGILGFHGFLDLFVDFCG